MTIFNLLQGWITPPTSTKPTNHGASRLPGGLGWQNAQGRSLCGGGAAGARPGQRESPSGAAPANLVVPAFSAPSSKGAKSRSPTAASTRDSSVMGLRERGVALLLTKTNKVRLFLNP